MDHHDKARLFMLLTVRERHGRVLAEAQHTVRLFERLYADEIERLTAAAAEAEKA